MDRSAVKAIVDECIERYLERLGIPHWKLRISYDLREDRGPHRVRGQCDRLIDYNKAHIDLDPGDFDEDDPKVKEEIHHTLRHELYHIVISPFDLFLQTARRAVGDDAEKLDMLDRVWDHSCEKTIINIERMYHGLTHEPKEKEPEPCPPSPPSSPAPSA